jgi:soluble lytic murein transglycosylase
MKEGVIMKKRQLTMPALIVFLLFLISVPQKARADFYMYVDEEGVTHITNVPTSSKYKWVMSASEKWGVDPVLVKAVIRAESNFNPDAVSRAGARGLMQLMPETARLMGVKNINDPAENVEGGVRYLKKLLKSFHWDVTLALAAYNAGEAAVRKYGGIPPFTETVNFVKRVLSNWKSYRSSSR